jgi:hypothetical protein
MRRLVLTSLFALALVSAGCGGDDHDTPPLGSKERPVAATVQEQPVAPAASAPGAAEASAAPRVNEAGVAQQPASSKAKSKSSASAKSGAEASTPSYSGLLDQQKANEETGTTTERFSPCNLVTEARATTIMGSKIRQPLLAPQGPTCIYRGASGKAFVTVAVQDASLAKLERHLRDAKPVAVGGHDGVCGTFSRPTLYVRVSGGRVLSITAPCAMAKSFAAAAIHELD